MSETAAARSSPDGPRKAHRTSVNSSTSRRIEIIERSTALFASKGYARTSLDDIMSEMGISGPAFYYYFKSKPAVLVAMLDQGMAAAEDAIDRLESDDAIKPLERAIQAVIAHADVIASNRDLARVLFTETRELPSEVAALIRKRMRDHNARVASLYAQALGKEADSPEVVGAIALLLGMANWIAFLPRRSSGPWDAVMREQLSRIVRRALDSTSNSA